MLAKNYRDLDMWQKGMELCEKIYEISRSFPKHEVYGLASQLQRCAVSVPSNIAEGFTRRSRPEFKRFLSIAQGSLAELETQIDLATRLGYLEKAERDAQFKVTSHLGKMITKFHQKMR